MKKEEKQKKKKRKILLSLIMILFVGVVLTASTYTWFTANRTVTVDQLDVNVSTSTGLQISVDATNWKTLITKDDILGAQANYTNAVNQVPAGQTTPVSSIGEVDPATGFIKMFKGELVNDEEEGHLVLSAEQSTETNGTTGDFIAFDLFFQTNEAMEIRLTSNSNVVAGATDTSIENAARVAFIPQGHAEAGTAPAEIQALKAADSTEVKIWEPNFDVHTASAVNNAWDSYQLRTQQTGATRLKYYGVKADIPTGAKIPVNSQDSTYFADMDTTLADRLLSTPESGIPTDDYLEVLSLEAGVTKVRIYMWVEGQDVDCENYASGGDLAFNLQFTSLENAG